MLLVEPMIHFRCSAWEIKDYIEVLMKIMPSGTSELHFDQQDKNKTFISITLLLILNLMMQLEVYWLSS